MKKYSWAWKEKDKEPRFQEHPQQVPEGGFGIYGKSNQTFLEFVEEVFEKSTRNLEAIYYIVED